MGRRRESRELVLQCLHQWDQQGPDSGRETAEAFMREQAGESAEIADYARELLAAYWERATEIDEQIEKVAQHWSMHRMAVVDRNILRLAVTELLEMDSVPPRVSIDEAIELAKKYSTERSGSFVNGILDKIMAELETENGNSGN